MARFSGKISRYFLWSELVAEADMYALGDREILALRNLAALLDRVRENYGKAVRVNSGYRTPAHNAEVDGASSSQHMYGEAADIEPLNAPMSPGFVNACRLANPFKLGIYPKHCHVSIPSFNLVAHATPAEWQGEYGG